MDNSVPVNGYLLLHDLCLGDPNTGKALKYYALQLLFNFGWSILFFGLSQYLLSFIWLIALILLIAVMIYQFYKISLWQPAYRFHTCYGVCSPHI